MELDIITAVDLIGAAEKTPFYGDISFLKKLLGEETFKKMHILGYFTIGLYLHDNKINHVYVPTRRYLNIRKSISRERRFRFLKTIKNKLKKAFE